MYPCTKFQSIWKTSDFGTKLPPKIMNDKNLKKRTSTAAVDTRYLKVEVAE